LLKHLTILLCLAVHLAAKPPELTPRDTRIKVEEILKTHATYHVLSEELIKRVLSNYLEELDPSKTYLIDSEIAQWTSPSEELIARVLEGFNKENFTTFKEIHAAMVQAIARRGALEPQMASQPLPKGVRHTEFKDLPWAKNEEELTTRLIRIKGLQKEAAEKLDEKARSTFFQRVEKRRLKREEELLDPDPTRKEQLILATILKAVSSSLDSQTTYFTPAEAAQFMIQVQQRLFGVGAQLHDELNGFSVLRIIEGSPAALDGRLRVGDKLIAVNGEPIIGLDISEAVELIRGQQDSAVTLTIIRKSGDTEEKIDLDIVRNEIVLKDTRLESQFEPFGDGAFGILRLFSFYQDPKYSSASDLREAIEKLKSEHNLKGIILDLRNNAGGLLPQAVAVAGLFIKKGVVVSVKDNTGLIQRLRNVESKVCWEGPLMILANRASASAAEIVTQTLQEYGRAFVVGDDHTYGKGTFQTFTLEATNYGKVNPKGEYKVTRGRYYTVSGKSPQLVGAKADIVVPSILAEMDFGEEFSKFPLNTDQITPSFHDDLSDIPAIHRHQAMKLYQCDLQPILTTYQPYLDVLKKNSSARLSQSKNFQNFSQEIHRRDFTLEPLVPFGVADLQMAEALNIFKDLIMLQRKPSGSS